MEPQPEAMRFITQNVSLEQKKQILLQDLRYYERILAGLDPVQSPATYQIWDGLRKSAENQLAEIGSTREGKHILPAFKPDIPPEVF